MTAPSANRHDVEATPPWLKAAPFVFLLLWSGGFPVAKIGLSYVDPMTLLLLRYVFVLALLVPIFAIMRPALPRRGADWGHLAVIGLLVQAIYFSLSWIAFAIGISAAAAALIIALQPVLVAVLAPHAVGERVGPARWIGLMLGLVGAVIVILSQSEVEPAEPLAVIATVGALIAMVSATLYEKRFGAPHHPVTSNLVQYSVGFAVVLPAAWLFEPMTVEWNWPLAAALAYLVLGNSLLAVSLLLAMIRHGEASRVSALFYLVPPCAAVLAWAVLGEQMPPLGWLGMAVAAVGVALASRAQAPAREG